MKFTEENKKYLSGEKFSNGHSLKYIDIEGAVERNAFLVSKFKGKKVLHIGFVDHLELIAQKRAEGIWLHDQLVAECRRTVGIDINTEGVDQIRQCNPDFELLACNLVTDPVNEIIAGDSWDYMLLADVIEHIDNPVEFLQTLKEKYAKYVDRIVVTTPNSFRLANIKSSLKSQEIINSDHRYWFTPFTLAKISTIAGIREIDIKTVEHGRLRKRNIPKRAFLKAFPLLKDTLVLEGKLV